jgi:uncharacterized protein (DUF4415 family)
LDNTILDYFRGVVHQAGGGNYQTLINEALLEHVHRRPTLDGVRHVVREELVPSGGGRRASRRSLKSDLARVDAHSVKPEEYKELPELTEEMLARAKVNKGGRPLSSNPRRLISLRLPADVIERWRATGPGWQTRMAERLSKVR